MSHHRQRSVKADIASHRGRVRGTRHFADDGEVEGEVACLLCALKEQHEHSWR